MQLSSVYGVTVAVSAANSGTSVKTLEGQVSSLTKQIDETLDDTKLDCKVKDARLGTLRDQLGRVRSQLDEMRAKEDESAPSDTESSVEASRAARAAAAAQRGGVDVWV